MIYVGVAATAIVGAFVDYCSLTILVGILAVLPALCFIVLPDGPTYLLVKNERKQAERALAFYRRNSCNVVKELDILQAGIKHVKATKLVDLFKSRATMRGLVCTVGLVIFQHLSGVAVIIFYTVQIFQETGAAVDAYTCSIIIAIMQLLSAFLAVFIMETANRRTYLFISTSGMALALVSTRTNIIFIILHTAFKIKLPLSRV